MKGKPTDLGRILRRSCLTGYIIEVNIKWSQNKGIRMTKIIDTIKKKTGAGVKTNKE